MCVCVERFHKKNEYKDKHVINLFLLVKCIND